MTETYKLTAEDAAYLIMPTFHIHGLIGVLLSTLFSAGTVVMPVRTIRE
jgi:acyl-CoA synthetase (AMP-forming)/AMP-acid ligase II